MGFGVQSQYGLEINPEKGKMNIQKLGYLEIKQKYDMFRSIFRKGQINRRYSPPTAWWGKSLLN